MGFFKNKKRGLEISKTQSFISLAFTKVKQDMMHVTNWLQYFHQKHEQHDYRLDMIEQQLSSMPKTKEEIKEIVDSYYSHEDIQNKIKGISQRLDEIERKKLQEPGQRIDELEHRKLLELNQRLRDVEVRGYESKRGIKEKLIKKITKNSKDYVKGVMLSLVKKYSKISAPQLKDMIVEEQGLCSKSSFYRLLTELENDEEIDTIQHGKERIYLYKTSIIK